MKKTIIIGSRESKLAVVQSQMVISYFKENYPKIKTDLLTMKTTGDKILDRTLDQIGGKGLFVKELDKALLDKRSDLSVHSLKDMPMEIPESLPLLGFSRREDPRDVLILPKGINYLDYNKAIGCSSLRRIIQLKELFPEALFKNVRGNVLTRLEKLDRGEYSALVLAAAGIKRLGLTERISSYFSVKEVLPAAGQGILALQGRQGEDYGFLNDFFDEKATYAALAERAFVRRLNGGCSSPVAAYAEVKEDYLQLTGFYFNEFTRAYCKGSLEDRVEYAEELGIRLAEKLGGKR